MIASQNRCNLIVDSCCDLPKEVLDQEGVFLIKFPYVMDGQSYEDDMYQSLSAHEFYEAMRKGANCSTAQISIPVLKETFQRAIATGIPTVYLCFTSGMSGSFDAAKLVADELLKENPESELYIVDTRLASIAEGVLVLEALNQRDGGLSAAELAAWAEEVRFYVNEQFTIDSLEWLKKGGRIPSSVAFAGTKLDVKPLLDITLDGKLGLTGACRGRKKSIRALVEYYKDRSVEGHSKTIVIGNADCPKDAQRLKDELLKIDDTLVFVDCSIGPVIGSHVGPGMLALAFMGKDERERMAMTDRIASKVRGQKA